MKPILHIYTRVSSAVQAEEGTSLQTQEDQGVQKAEALGYAFKVWNEGGQSSKYEDLENRPVLKRLLLEIESCNVEHLFVYNTDRLSRNQKTWVMIRLRLKEHGVKLYTPSGVMDLSSASDDLIIGIMSEFSQYDNAIRAERSRLGKLNKIRQGFWMGGPPPYGYKIEGSKLVENPDESQWIKKIYQWYVKGKSTQFIKGKLDINGVQPRRKKGLWTLGSIQKILKNTQYIGHYTYRDKKLDESVECSCPAFLNERTWHAAQARREKTIERKGQNNRTQHFYLLRNLMVCGHCGTPMGGRIKPSKNERLYYCPNKERSWVSSPPKVDEKWDRSRGCQMRRSLNIPRTDAIIWQNVVDVMSNSDMLKRRVEEKFGGEENLKKELAAKKKLQKRLKLRLKKIEEALAQVTMEHTLDDIGKQAFETFQDRFHQEKDHVSERLGQSREQLKSMGDREKWMDAVSRLHLNLEKIETKSEEDKKRFLELFVERIDVRFDDKTKEHELTIKFSLPLIEEPIPGDATSEASPYMRGVIIPPLETTPQSHSSPNCAVGRRRCL